MKYSTLFNRLRLLIIVAAAINALNHVAAWGGPAVIDTAINPGNGHVYYLLASSDWTDAENAAEALNGHLATIRNQDENDWIWNRWGTNRSLWIGFHDPVIGDGGGSTHAANFIWTSGESTAFANWNYGEPNGDDYTYIIAKGVSGAGMWNDIAAGAAFSGQPPQYGVAEVSTCTPHHATARAIMYGQFVVDAAITDVGCGYTNPPQVTISGAGGSGATATATIANGVVRAINIVSTGSGYTNAPQILISSPPFVPAVAIKFSAVKVMQHLMLGVNYQLESSSNLVDWAVVGPVFTATNENMVSEFEIDSTGQFFRVLQEP